MMLMSSELFSSAVNDFILTDSNTLIEAKENNKEREDVLQRLRLLELLSQNERIL